jgi:uncharacterized protein YqgC (DUF456 family)
MIDWSSIAHSTGLAAGWIVVALLCLAGLVVSCLTLSGTWLVVGAAGLAAWLSGPAFPGWITVTVFAVIALAVEGAEWMAGLWGVQRRGGSTRAGWAAMGGGLLGMIVGGLFTFVGSLIGMMVGSFAAAYYVEKHRLQAHDPALHIAWGTVLARVLVLFLKMGATLGMIAALITGAWLAD